MGGDLMKKRILIFLVLFCVLNTSCFDYPRRIQPSPSKSKKETVVVYNEGCCFIINNFELKCISDSGERQVLMSWDELEYTDLCSVPLAIEFDGPFTIYASFYFEYAEAGTTEFPILYCEDAYALEKDGLLLLIGDADLYLKTNGHEAKFKYDESPWVDHFIPA